MTTVPVICTIRCVSKSWSAERCQTHRLRRMVKLNLRVEGGVPALEAFLEIPENRERIEEFALRRSEEWGMIGQTVDIDYICDDDEYNLSDDE